LASVIFRIRLFQSVFFVTARVTGILLCIWLATGEGTHDYIFW
jgi:hypothetical protein